MSKTEQKPTRNNASPYKQSKFNMDYTMFPSFKNILATVKSQERDSDSSIDCGSPIDAEKQVHTQLNDSQNKESPTIPLNYFSNNDINNDDTPTPSYVGLPAIKSFNRKYSMCNKASCSESHHSATFAYLRACETTRRAPRMNGIVKLRGPTTDMNLK